MAENSFQPFTRRQTMIRRDFEIYRYRYMDEVELHHHDFYEIYMLLRGSVSYTVENRIFHMRAGDLMLISPLERTKRGLTAMMNLTSALCCGWTAGIWNPFPARTPA